MPTKKQKPEITFNQIIEALLDISTPFPPKYLHKFSDLQAENIDLLMKAWPNIDSERRAALLEDLENLHDSDTLISFEDLAFKLLKDSDSRIRLSALHLLEDCEDKRLIPILMDMMKNDLEETIKVEATDALGAFVYLGELEEIPAKLHHQVENALLGVYAASGSIEIRRSVLESLGYSSRDEVPPLIQAAYESGDSHLRSSSLTAMGRSADLQWVDKVIENLASSDLEIQHEAILAAAELELPKARPILINLLNNPEDQDVQIRRAAVYALAHIGGKEVHSFLVGLQNETKDDEESEFIASAIEYLDLTDGLDPFGLVTFDIQSEEDLDDIVDLESENDLKKKDGKPGKKKPSG